MKIQSFLEAVLNGNLSFEEQKTYLLGKTSFTAEELAEAVLYLSGRSVEFPGLKEAIDVCGTGGSGLPRINTSTLSSIILSSMGVKVAKHGNKAASGRFGSFDLLEALGIEVSSPEALFQREGLAFLYAPDFHPDFKAFVPARRAVGRRTFFNLLGPLLNPAEVSRQLIGTPFPDEVELIAQVCQLLGKEHVLVVSGDGLDEVSLTGPTVGFELRKGEISSFTLTPEDFGLTSVPFEAIRSHGPEFNLQIIDSIFSGEPTAYRDLVLVNVALALRLRGDCDLKEAYQAAMETVQTGKASQKLARLKTPSILLEIADHKRKEVEIRKTSGLSFNSLALSDRDFKQALKDRAVIAEVKFKSPTLGEVKQGHSLESIVQSYEQNGAGAISVLCDSKYFSGSLEYLTQARAATQSIPLLCKDFILDEFQIFEARHYGADAILLIAALLSKEQIQRFIEMARSLNMDALCEVHTLDELYKVLDTDAEIIGINNRNLHTFQINLSTTDSLLPYVPKHKVVVSESGMETFHDVPERVDAILVGTSLMKHAFPELKLRELRGKPLIKVCGIQTVEEARVCEGLGVDFVGLNFVPQSSRLLSMDRAREIRTVLNTTKAVGVFQNQSLEAVNRLAQDLNLDLIQLSGEEDQAYIDGCIRPVIKSLSSFPEVLPKAAFLLVDSSSGKGNGFDSALVDQLNQAGHSFLLAGGLSPETIRSVLRSRRPLGVDVASGVESDGQRDVAKLFYFIKEVRDV